MVAGGVDIDPDNILNNVHEVVGYPGSSTSNTHMLFKSGMPKSLPWL